MATAPTNKTKPAPRQLKIRLVSLRLKKLFIEVLLPPEEAGKGSMELSYNIATSPKDDQGYRVAVVSINGRGMNKEDTSKTAFTIDTEMYGMFDVSRNPKKNEENALATNMANHIIPVLTDMIETTLSRSGYPRIVLQKGFPEES